MLQTKIKENAICGWCEEKEHLETGYKKLQEVKATCDQKGHSTLNCPQKMKSNETEPRILLICTRRRVNGIAEYRIKVEILAKGIGTTAIIKIQFFVSGVAGMGICKEVVE